MTLALFTWATPNGHKPQIMLEELGVPYEVKPINIFEGEQMADSFRLINPNRRIPVLIDSSEEYQPPLRVFESGAILLHLAEKFGKFLPKSNRGRSEALQWLMWQMGGLGPMFGQAQHFCTYATERYPYSMDRFSKEAFRLCEVMDWHLGQHEYLADEYSIADIACFPWIRIHKLTHVSIDAFPNLARWYGVIRTRPAVDRGLGVLRDHLTGVPRTKEARDIMFGKTQFRELDNKLGR